MDEHKDILEQIGHKDGMTVPPGYFADFASRMAASLLETDFERSAKANIEPPRSFWHRIRPYTYMAAMFAGVWCMLKMFTMLTAAPGSQQLDPSPVLANALNNEVFVNEYIIDDVDQWDLMDELMEEGFDVQTLALPVSDSDLETQQMQL